MSTAATMWVRSGWDPTIHGDDGPCDAPWGFDVQGRCKRCGYRLTEAEQSELERRETFPKMHSRDDD